MWIKIAEKEEIYAKVNKYGKYGSISYFGEDVLKPKIDLYGKVVFARYAPPKYEVPLNGDTWTFHPEFVEVVDYIDFFLKSKDEN